MGRCQSWKCLKEKEETQKRVLHTFNKSILSMFNLNTRASRVIYNLFYLCALFWGLYVMQTYISLLILLLVNHAWQVLNNNGCGLLWTSGCWWRQLCSMVWVHMYHIKDWRFSLYEHAEGWFYWLYDCLLEVSITCWKYYKNSLQKCNLVCT